MCTSSCCVLMCLGMGLAWLLVASLLLWQTWNRVICVICTQKPQLKFWQPLLVLVCICVLFLPCMARKKMHEHGHCPMNKCEDMSKGDCCQDKAGDKASEKH